jgi:hypothetical protein
MQAENRISVTFSGNNTDGTTNIIPKMDPDVLFNGYRRLLQQIYSPHLFYQRVRTLLTELHPRRATVHMEWRELMAFFKSIWKLGILGEERWEYWSLFFWAVFTHPNQIPLAVTFAIYGYHFRKISDIYVQTKTALQPAKSQRVSKPAKTGALPVSGG